MKVGDLVKIVNSDLYTGSGVSSEQSTGFELNKGFIKEIKRDKRVVRQYNGKDTLQVTDLVLVRLFDGMKVWTYKENIKILNKKDSTIV